MLFYRQYPSMFLSSSYYVYILLTADEQFFFQKHIDSRLSVSIFVSGYNFEIVDHMNCIDNVVFFSYKILSFLFYLIRNMDIFLLIFQPSEFLLTYLVVPEKVTTY